MSGTEIRLLDKTLFDFGNVANGSAGGDMFYAQNVGAALYTQGALLVRVHAKTVPGTAKVVFKAYPSAPTNEDPATTYRAPALTLTPAVEIVTGTAVGALLLGGLSTPFGGHIDFCLQPQYQAGGGAFSVVISVDLVLKA
jgi:hypothetical protein